MNCTCLLEAARSKDLPVGPGRIVDPWCPEHGDMARFYDLPNHPLGISREEYAAVYEWLMRDRP